MNPSVKSSVACPACGGALRYAPASARCEQCLAEFPIADGRLFLSAPPADVPARSSEDLTSLLDEAEFSDLRKATYEHLLGALETLPDGALLLDLSAGRSVYREALARFRIVSSDFFPFDLVDVVADTSGKLPFKDDAFDAVLLSHVLEHMPTPTLTLSETCRILKPSGLLIAHTPFMLGLHDEPYDYFRYTKYGIERVLGDAGFEDVRIQMLSDLLDVHATFVRDLFGAALGGLRGGSPGEWLRRFLLRGARKAHGLAFALLAPLLLGAKDERYPKGYGFTARRMSSRV